MLICTQGDANILLKNILSKSTNSVDDILNVIPNKNKNTDSKEIIASNFLLEHLDLFIESDKNIKLLMSRDTIVAVVCDNDVILKDDNLVPLYIKRTNNFEGWLKTRSIDIHRPHSRLLKKALRLIQLEEIGLVMYSNAATITDTYWVKSYPYNKTYSDVQFRTDTFSDLALKGDASAFFIEPELTPELTAIGSYEKCWKIRNSEWCMYKNGTDLEKFSELFVYYLCKILKMNVAEYMVDNGYIVTRDFTHNAQWNFEPMFSLIGDNEDYIDNIELLKSISPDFVKDYLNILFIDTLVMNVDRHTFNYGVLRDVITGRILAVAPNFDNNLALVAGGISDTLKVENNLLLKLFLKALDYTEYHLPQLTEDMLLTVLTQTKNDLRHVNVDDKLIISFILNTYNAIINHQHKR